ncbi:hypothetical protein ACLOAU_11760 [Niabella sp. CJ426]|uniref:hypothetical protein n=1 Tax=Niabella sp. CJ426 TaxID=3393740 RepID=UPI003CFF56FF
MKKQLFIWLMLCAFSIHSYAQCPASITTSTASVTSATCPSNGSFTINSNVSGVATATYQIISSTTGYTTNIQSSRTFAGLQPGSYTVRVSCDAATTTTTVTVGSNYTAPTLTTTVSNLCTNFQPGGTITATGAGSSTPLQYAILLSNDAGASDDLFTYGTGNVFNPTAFGTYQVRVKDNCGNYVTRTVQLLRSAPRVNYAVTGTTYPTCAAVNETFSFTNATNNQTVNPVNSGYRVEVWESSAAGCPGLPSGAATQTKTLNSASVTADFTFNRTTRSYYYRITSPCGEVTTGCRAIPVFSLTVNADVMVGCSSRPGSSNQIGFNFNGQSPFNVSVTGYNAAGGVVFGPTAFNNVSSNYVAVPAAARYTYTFTDACGSTATGEAVTPSAAPSILSVTTKVGCSNVLGTTNVTVRFTGLIPDLYNMNNSSVRLVNVATGASIPAIDFSRRDQVAIFNNVTPGNYRLELTPNLSPNIVACNTQINVTVPATNLFNFTLAASVTQLCGGTGTLQASATTNSPGAVAFQLLNSGGTVIASNASGTFANIAAGSYTVVGLVTNTCAGSNYNTTRTVTILGAGQPPVISKKIGMVCEPSSTTGLAAFEFVGAGPLTLRMKKKSETAYTTISTDAGTSHVVNNLTANETYDVLLSDACGATTSTEVQIRPLTAIAKTTTEQPCAGQPYTLGVEELPGATYAWSLNGGGTISTAASLNFASYQASNDGTYTCTVSFGGCVSRVVTFNVNSQLCGGSLSVNFGNLTAVLHNGLLQINWTSLKEENNLIFEIEGSIDGTNFYKIGHVESKAEHGTSSEPIDYTFETNLSKATGAMAVLSGLFLLGIGAHKRRKAWIALACISLITGTAISCSKSERELINEEGSLYIRLATVDKDGKREVSKIVKVIKK